MRLIFVLFLICCSSSAIALDTLFIKGNERRIDLLGHSSALKSREENENIAWRKLAKDGIALKSSSVGFTENVFYWVAFTLKNMNAQQLEFLFELDNPQIDILEIYSVTSSSNPALLLRTGDKLPFDHRLIMHRNFLLPIRLQPRQTETVLLKIDKRNSSISFPMFLWNPVQFHEKDYQHNLGYGIYFGFLLLCLTYSTLTYIFLRKAIYLWYSLWIIFSGLVVATALGFSFQYLYPWTTDFNSVGRVYVELLSTACVGCFLKYFLNIPVIFPKLNKWITGIIYFFFLLVVAIPLLSMYQAGSFILLPLINVSVVVLIFLFLYAAVIGFKQQKRTTLFFLSAFGAVIIASITIILSEFGVLSTERLTVNPYMVGSAIEILLFSVGLTFQVKEVYDDRNTLQIKISHHQKEMMHAYVDGIEKERSRIAGDLHDDIGSRLGNLYRMIGLPGQNEAQLKQQVELISNDVRSLSHQLAVDHNRKGPKQMLIDLVSEIQPTTATKIDLQFYDVPQELDAELTQQFYRCVQEILGNMMKHSKATQADIQLYGYESELVFTYEDNGVGFDPSRQSKGIGLHQLQRRLQTLKGSIEISSALGSGVQMMIRVPL
jgi:signal transduction histidine kinase